MYLGQFDTILHVHVPESMTLHSTIRFIFQTWQDTVIIISDIKYV